MTGWPKQAQASRDYAGASKSQSRDGHTSD